MARALTAKEAKVLQNQSEQEEAQKRAEQEAEGKEFVNNGHGVIPEEHWQNLPGKTSLAEQGEDATGASEQPEE